MCRPPIVLLVMTIIWENYDVFTGVNISEVEYLKE